MRRGRWTWSDFLLAALLALLLAAPLAFVWWGGP